MFVPMMDRNKQLRVALSRFIEQNGVKKTVLAKRLQVTRGELYAFLAPEKYPQVRIAASKRRRIEEFARKAAA